MGLFVRERIENAEFSNHNRSGFIDYDVVEFDVEHKFIGLFKIHRTRFRARLISILNGNKGWICINKQGPFRGKRFNSRITRRLNELREAELFDSGEGE